MKTALGIKIGADPEFVFKRNGQLVRANEIFGYDTSSQVGTDGASHTAEIRPSAGAYYILTQEISNLIGIAKNKAANCEAYAGSGDVVPLGGHIHFSGIAAEPTLIERLEKFITTPLNSVSDRTVRNRHNYGRRGEVRTQPHGWEFRSPLSWLSTPILANGVLAIAWVLARAQKHNVALDDKDALIEYAYKRERIAIKMFYQAIAEYKKNNTKLETIEMFKAWGKTNNAVPSNLPVFSADDFMPAIADAITHHTERYNPFACYKRIHFYGVRSDRMTGIAVEVQPEDCWLANAKHLGAKVNVNEDGRYGAPGIVKIGLSYDLRKDTKACAWTIKRLIKAINDKAQQPAAGVSAQ